MSVWRQRLVLFFVIICALWEPTFQESCSEQHDGMLKNMDKCKLDVGLKYSGKCYNYRRDANGKFRDPVECQENVTVFANHSILVETETATYVTFQYKPGLKVNLYHLMGDPNYYQNANKPEDDFNVQACQSSGFLVRVTCDAKKMIRLSITFDDKAQSVDWSKGMFLMPMLRKKKLLSTPDPSGPRMRGLKNLFPKITQATRFAGPVIRNLLQIPTLINIPKLNTMTNSISPDIAKTIQLSSSTMFPSNKPTQVFGSLPTSPSGEIISPATETMQDTVQTHTANDKSCEKFQFPEALAAYLKRIFAPFMRKIMFPEFKIPPNNNIQLTESKQPVFFPKPIIRPPQFLPKAKQPYPNINEPIENIVPKQRQNNGNLVLFDREISPLMKDPVVLNSDLSLESEPSLQDNKECDKFRVFPDDSNDNRNLKNMNNRRWNQFRYPYKLKRRPFPVEHDNYNLPPNIINRLSLKNLRNQFESNNIQRLFKLVKKKRSIQPKLVKTSVSNQDGKEMTKEYQTFAITAAPAVKENNKSSTSKMISKMLIPVEADQIKGNTSVWSEKLVKKNSTIINSASKGETGIRVKFSREVPVKKKVITRGLALPSEYSSNIQKQLETAHRSYHKENLKTYSGLKRPENKEWLFAPNNNNNINNKFQQPYQGRSANVAKEDDNFTPSQWVENLVPLRRAIPAKPEVNNNLNLAKPPLEEPSPPRKIKIENDLYEPIGENDDVMPFYQPYYPDGVGYYDPEAMDYYSFFE